MEAKKLGYDIKSQAELIVDLPSPKKTRQIIDLEPTSAERKVTPEYDISDIIGKKKFFKSFSNLASSLFKLRYETRNLRRSRSLLQPTYQDQRPRPYLTANPELTPLREQTSGSGHGKTPAQSLHSLKIETKNDRTEEENSKTKSDHDTKNSELFKLMLTGGKNTA